LDRERDAHAADCETARAAHDESERRHADEIGAATAKFADLESRHNRALQQHAAATDNHGVAYAALERRLAETQSEHQNLLERAADDRAEAERTTAVLESRRAALAGELAATMSALDHERQARAADGETARAAHDELERRHADEIAAATAKF